MIFFFSYKDFFFQYTDNFIKNFGFDLIVKNNSFIADFSFLDESYYDFYPIIKIFFFNLNNNFFNIFKDKAKDKIDALFFFSKELPTDGYFYKPIPINIDYFLNVTIKNELPPPNGLGIYLERLKQLFFNDYYVDKFGKDSAFIFDDYNEDKLRADRVASTVILERLAQKKDLFNFLYDSFWKEVDIFYNFIDSGSMTLNSGFSFFFEYLSKNNINLFPKKYNYLSYKILGGFLFNEQIPVVFAWKF